MFRSNWDTARPSPDFEYWTLTIYGRPFHAVPLSFEMPYRSPATPDRKRPGLDSSAFARRYLRNHYCFLLHRVLRCFTSPGVAPWPYEFRPRFPDITLEGFPHSEIPGSKCVCHSPRLIAAYHVLHRILLPRHSLCALMRLTKNSGLLSTKLHARFYAVVKDQSFAIVDLGLESLSPQPQMANRNMKLRVCPTVFVRPYWWACVESNHGPCPYQGHALTN